MIFLFLLLFSIVSFAVFLTTYPHISQVFTSFGILFLGLYLVWKENLKTTKDNLGFPGDIKVNLLYIIGGIGAILVFTLLFSYTATMLGFNDQSKILDKLSTLPWYVLVLAVTIAPIGEELLFRGYLVPRTGIIISSLIFGAGHLAYGSVVEIIGATSIGIILAFLFKKSQSIAPCIVVHIIYNLMSLLFMNLLA